MGVVGYSDRGRVKIETFKIERRCRSSGRLDRLLTVGLLAGEMTLVVVWRRAACIEGRRGVWLLGRGPGGSLSVPRSVLGSIF